MSLQIAAKHLAAKGRGPDTTLVHMTNKEVQGLQALAEKNGGSLSINPDTGLPEAGFLESILPVVAGVGLTAAGMGPMAAALTVGGVSALSTGSLSKGLFAGLGAYGGASLGGHLAAQGMTEAAAANASFGDKLASMGQNASFENIGNFISANPKTAMAGLAGPLLSSMEDDNQNDKPPEPEKDTDLGERARSGVKFNPGYMTPTPLPNPYGIEQTYARPYYAAEGGVAHMAEGGMAYGGSTSIDTKSQFAEYLKKVMDPTNRGNAVSGGTNPYEWWKSPNTTEAKPVTPAPSSGETAEESAARARLNARGGGGQSQEQKDQREADLDRVDDYLSTLENPVTMRQYWEMSKEDRDKLNADAAERHPIRGGIGEFVKTAGYPMFLRGIEGLKDAYGRLIGPDTSNPKSVGTVFPTEKDRIKAEQMAKYKQALLGDTSPYINNVGENQNIGPGTPEFNAARQAATPSAGPNMYIGSSLDPYSPIDRVTATDAANAAYQREQADAAEQARMENDTIAADYGYNQGLAQQRGIAANPFSPQDANKALRNAYYQSYPRVTTTPEAQQAAIDNLTQDSFYAAKPDDTPESLQQADAATNARLLGLNPPDPMAPVKEKLAASYAKEDKIAADKAKETADIEAARIESNPVLKEWKAWLENHSDDATKPVSTPDIAGTNEISAAPDDTTLSQFTNAFAGDTALPAGYIGAPIGTYAMNADGTVSDAGNGLGVAGIPAPNMGYYSNNQGGRGLGVPGFGGVWRSSEGVPIRTGDGSSLQTGEGAQQESSNDRVERIMREAQEANPGSGNDGSDNNGAGVHEGGYSNSLTRSNDQGDGGGADGGLSTPYGFQHMAQGGLSAMANPYDLGSYSDGGRLLKGPGDGVSDSIPATIGKGRPARLADGEFVIPARIVSEIGNGSTDAGARKLYAMMDRIQAGRKKSVGKGRVAVNSRADKYLPA